MLFALTCNLQYAMQRVEILKKLACEKSNVTQKLLKDAHTLLKLSTKKYDAQLASKALWGLAAAWDDSFGVTGIELAQFLIAAGADPLKEIEIEDFIQTKKPDGSICCMTGNSYETTAFSASSGALKKYLESFNS